MQRLSNIQSLRGDKRLDVLVKKQEEEHRHLIASHHKEMQQLRDALKLSMERCEALSKKNEEDLKEFKNWATNHLSFLSDRVIGNEVTISEEKKSLVVAHKSLNELHEIYVSKIDSEKIKKELIDLLHSSTMAHLKAFQEWQREFKMLFISHRENMENIIFSLEKKLEELKGKSESNFSIAMIDKDGVLNEVTRYKKDLFYIEKKIENIYTLIDRINKREEK